MQRRILRSVQRSKRSLQLVHPVVTLTSTNARLLSHQKLAFQARNLFTLQKKASESTFEPAQVQTFEYSPTKDNALILIEAVKANDLSLIEKFIKQSPSLATQQPNVSDDRIGDDSPAHRASRIGNLKALEKIVTTFKSSVKNGEEFNVNYRCHCTERRTMLSYAVRGGHEAVVEYLFSIGAKPDIRDERGWTALDEAIHGITQEKNTEAYERIALMISNNGGTANKFQADEIIKSITAKLILEKYKNNKASETDEHHFIEQIYNPLQITRGK